jgi:HAD superfamily hydrolase (TIGR01549 family)
MNNKKIGLVFDIGDTIIDAKEIQDHLFSIPDDIMRKTLGAFDIKKNANLYWSLSIYREKVKEQIHRDSELIDVLTRLREKRYKLGIVSDGTIDEQIYTLFKMGIIGFFDAIVISEAIGVKKPDRRIFEAIIKDLAIEAENIFIIGDDLKNDIIGGKKCGLKTVWVTETIPRDFHSNYGRYIDITINKVQIRSIDSILESFLGGKR